MTLKKTTLSDLEHIAPLFDAYRVFYGQPSDLEAARSFLKERFTNEDNVVFLAYEGEKAIGFTQLYKTFSSVSMQPLYILNDLFVLPEHRKNGAGEALLEKAKVHCLEMGFKGLTLETAADNPAQKLYERLDWKKDTAFFHYFWKNPR